MKESKERLIKCKLSSQKKKNQKCKNIGNLADSRKLLSHQLVHIAVKHNVDMTLQAYPDVIKFVCKGDSS